ncbi:efflux transporter outer membrane subunit [Poriferisphaera sp. WC338]|uniref:efflux transporter outer membrane subunit n=1 Tax=Poriferisphaera sp. WC338 TaxID=3425129 RepID=UPI003D81811F
MPRTQTAILKVAFVSMIALLASSCITAPESPLQPINMPTTFSQSSSPSAQPLETQWWLSFQDKQLNALIDTALTNNFNIKSAWARIDQSAAIARQSSASLFPSLDGTGRTSRSRNEINSPSNPGQPATTTYSNSFSLGLTASYEIDLWGRIRATANAANLDNQAVVFDLQTTAISLSAQIADTWYNLIDQNAQCALLEQQIKTNQQHLDILSERFNRGLVGAPDVLQQEQLLESTRTEKIRADLQSKILQHQLSVLLGEAPTAKTFATPDQFITLPNLPDTGLPADLLTKRPDLQAAFTRLQSSNQRIAAAIADQYPRLSITASTSTDSVHIRDLFDNWLATIAANMAAPIFDGGRRAAVVDQNKATAQQNFYTYAQTTLTALQEVEDALAREQHQRNILASIQSRERIASQVADQLYQNYLKGAEDFLRVLTAQQSLQQLQRQRLSANRDMIQSRIALCRAIAGPPPLTKPLEK